MQKPQSVTSIGMSPEDERRKRMLKYTAAMIIRVICIVLAMVIQGWLMWVFFLAAIFLPYFAVVLANVPGQTSDGGSLAKAVAPTLTISADAFNKPAEPKSN
jgi:predicted tellurium resistance membrane protein TerC